MKTQLNDLDKGDLMKLVGDLFKLSSENARFLDTRFSASSSALLAYKKIISEALYEKALKSDKVDFRTAKKAISSCPDFNIFVRYSCRSDSGSLFMSVAKQEIVM